jgi:glycosyltransferase involved in cell wall biosynthesis
VSTVDVVVPCYNYARFLKGCVDSALSQRDVDVRVLIIDDASSDNSAVVGKQLASADSRVTFRRHALNQGHIKTFNEGILDWACAPYTLLMSADDALTPGSLARSTRVLEDHPEVGFVYGMSLVIRDDSEKCSLVDKIVPVYQIISGPQFLRRSCEWGNPAASPSVVVRSSVQKRLGGHRAHLPHSCDMEMWMRFATQGPVGVIEDIQAYYREHGANMNLHYCNRTLGDSRQRIEACREIYKMWCTDRPTFGAWMNAQRRRLCDDAYWHAGRALEEGDDEGMAACLAFARDYEMVSWLSAAWWRFRIKAFLGRRQWCRIAPVIRGIPRGVSQAQVDVSPVNRKFGWWPDTTVD